MSIKRNTPHYTGSLSGGGGGRLGNGTSVTQRWSRSTTGEREDFAALFEDADFLVPSQEPSIPFEPGRTLEVTRKQWVYFSSLSEGNPSPSPTWLAQFFKFTKRRCCCCLPQFSCWPTQSLHHAPPPKDRSIFGLPILSPESRWVALWSIIISIVDLTYTSFFVAISIAFDNISPGSSWTWLTVLDCIGTGFYLTDIILEFHTGFIVKYDVHRIVIKRGTDVARQYVCNKNLNGFWVDFLSVAAIIPEVLGSALPGISGGGYKAFYLFRLLRLVRVARLLRAAWGVSFLSSPISRALFRRINTATFYLINILFVLAVFLNLMACLWWFLAELEGLENSWVGQTSFSLDLLNAGDPARYLTSLYFAISVITTVGFGDITAYTLPEMALAGVYMLCSLFYFGYVVNVVGALISEVSSRARSATNLRNKLENTELWMAERRIPPDLQHQIRRFYFELWAPHSGGLQDADYFLELPVVLRGRIVARLAGDAIRGSKMLGVLSPEVQAHLAEGAVPQRLIAGHNLCIEGDFADKFWVLQEGKVKFYRGMHATGEVHAPAVIGQAAVFAPWIADCRERMHTVRGVTSCTLWEFNSRPVQKVAKHDPRVLRVLCESYLQYLAGVEQRGQGRPLSKKVPRIKAQVEKMMKKAEEREKQQRIEEEREQEEEERKEKHERERSDLQPSPPPPPNPPPTPSFLPAAARHWYHKAMSSRNRGPPELSRESAVAIMENEQLPGPEEEEESGQGSIDRGGSRPESQSLGRELEELVIQEDQGSNRGNESVNNSHHSDTSGNSSRSSLLP